MNADTAFALSLFASVIGNLLLLRLIVVERKEREFQLEQSEARRVADESLWRNTKKDVACVERVLQEMGYELQPSSLERWVKK